MGVTRRKGTAILLSCIALSALWSYAIRKKSHAEGKLRMVDLAAIYYGARSVMHHQDPYDPSAFLREYEASHKEHSALGTVNYPGLSGASMKSPGPIISLQVTFSVLSENPQFFNSVSYLIGGLLILMWIVKVRGAPLSPERTRLALAAISVLTLLPVYHQPDDASLLLLAVPACATLWAAKEPMRMPALILTSAGIFFASDIPLALLGLCAKKLSLSASTLAGKMTTVFLLRPTPLVLLAMGCFYLWAFMRYRPGQSDLLDEEKTGNTSAATATPAT